MAERPADRCPYPRPFPDGFHACPAYQPAMFVGLDTGYHPLPPVWTCGHLDSAAIPERRSRYYPLCRIGTPAARDAWVSVQRLDRLAELRAMSDELNPLMVELTTVLWSAKADQLRAEPGSAEWTQATARLRELGGQFLTSLSAFLEERAERLAALGFPLEPTMRLFEDIIERWVEQPNAETPVVPDSALEQFPPDTRVFFKPDYGSGGA